jgi:hypothetical protein
MGKYAKIRRGLRFGKNRNIHGGTRIRRHTNLQVDKKRKRT